MRGPKPKPTAIRRRDGNPGKRGFNPSEPTPPEGQPDCPPHLTDAALAEWERLAPVLFDMGVLTTIDRAAFAAYCQAYGRWVEAEERLRQTPLLLKTPSGYVQQSPWLSVANKQLELMGRFMAEFGLTPASRSRIVVPDVVAADVQPFEIRLIPLRAVGDDEHLDRPALGPPTRDSDRAKRITRCEAVYQDETD